MSKTIRKYRGISDGFPDSSDMDVTAFVGGDHGNAVQLTVGNSYVCLSEKQIVDLRKILLKRILCKEGWTATGNGNNLKVIHPDGREDEDLE